MTALVVLCLIVFAIYLVRTSATGSRAIAGSSVVVPTSDRPNGSAFPWEIVKSDEPPKNASQGLNSEAKANTDEEINVADWMTGMEKPNIPVHEIVSKYRSNNYHTSAEKAQLVSGLSYCANRRTVGVVAGEQRSRGAVDDANSLLNVHQDYIKYCSGLDDAAFSLRRSIVENLADSGIAEAKIMFFEAGPLGRWPTANEHIPLTQDEIATWNKTAVKYLEQNVKDGDFRSYKTLASMYGASAGDPILGQISNQSTAYAYESLWVASLLANPETPKEVRASLANYMRNIEGKLSPEGKKEGLEKAARIHLNMKK
jgi:hypothetical protein